MDKYLQRTPREKPDKDVVACSSKSNLRQSTIHSLKGVVVVEDIERLKCKLQVPEQSVDILVSSLRELSRKIPPRHILISTKIGHSVNKLRKHPDAKVSVEAKRVYVKWKSFFKDKSEKPQIEVQCDQKTEATRQNAQSLLSNALGVEATHTIAEAVEREVFHLQGRKTLPTYKRTIRAMVFKLRNNEAVKSALLNQSISIEEFTKQNLKS